MDASPNMTSASQRRPRVGGDHPVKITARDVNVYYGDKQAIKNLSIDIPDRAVSSFIGPSGCGKSTFLRSINRMNDTIPSCRVTGLVELDGQNIYSPISIRCSCGLASAWCSRSPIRFPNRSSRTSPMGRGFTASPDRRRSSRRSW